MGDKPEFKQDVILRLERIEKLVNERSTRNFNRTPVHATYENKKNAYLTKLNKYYKIKYDEETKTYS